MSDDNEPATLIPFTPRREQPPELSFVELRLHDTGNIQMTVVDEDGNKTVLEYTLAEVPVGFIEKLRSTWPRWAEVSSIAS